MIAHLILVALFGWADDRDPATMVKALASTNQAAREDAAGTLEEIGRPALPALYAARDASEPDVRRQVALLIDLIERQQLLRATKVKLDFREQPLAEVIESIKEQTGFPLVLDSQKDPSLRARKITLEAPQPMAFWQVLDRLAEVGKVRHDPGVLWNPLRRRPLMRLIVDDGPPMRADQGGPFRINLVRLHRDRQVKLPRPPAKPAILEEFEAELQVFAEPGLVISNNGPLVLEAATDDSGQNLRPESISSTLLGRSEPFAFDTGNTSVISYEVPLKLPETPGRRLERLKGYIPLIVIARTSHPIVVPLADSTGKPFSSGGVTLRVTAVRHQDPTTSVDIEVRGEHFEPQSPERRLARLGNYEPPYRLTDHVQLIDTQGHICRWAAGPQRAAPDGAIAFTINETGPPEDAPAELHYHGIVGAAAQVVFEFRDLPMP